MFTCEGLPIGFRDCRSIQWDLQNVTQMKSIGPCVQDSEAKMARTLTWQYIIIITFNTSQTNNVRGLNIKFKLPSFFLACDNAL